MPGVGTYNYPSKFDKYIKKNLIIDYFIKFLLYKIDQIIKKWLNYWINE